MTLSFEVVGVFLIPSLAQFDETELQCHTLCRMGNQFAQLPQHIWTKGHDMCSIEFPTKVWGIGFRSLQEAFNEDFNVPLFWESDLLGCPGKYWIDGIDGIDEWMSSSGELEKQKCCCFFLRIC